MEGVELKVVVSISEFRDGSGRDFDRLDKKERLEIRDSEEYQNYLKSVKEFMEGVRLGKVEIAYPNKV